MSTFVENPVTGGMGDGNHPPLGFYLGEPDIVTDSYKYYGSINKKHRRGNGITLYTDGSILECKWKSNVQIEIGTPIFLLNSVPETDCADVHYFLRSMELRSQCFEYVGHHLKQAVGYLVAPTHTLYPAYVSGSVPTVIHMNDSRLAISDGYLFIYGRLYRRSKDTKYFISRSGFFGNLTNENTAIGIQIDDDFVKFGIFKFDPPKNEFIQGCVYNKDTAEETVVGDELPEGYGLGLVLEKTYNNYKQTQKSNPKVNFKNFVVYQKMPPLKSFESLKPKMIPLPEDDNWSDEEDTIIARAYAKKHSPTK